MRDNQLPGTPRAFDWADLAIGGLLITLIYLVVAVARQWSGPLQQAAEIRLEARYLPLYALFSLTRGVIAYGISFLFTMVYGYAMARAAGAERILLPLLDVFQSIPVLGFLPGFVLGLLRLFPRHNVGLEMASVLMIFTGQVCNMTFSFYSSLKSVPPDLVSVARLARMSWWQRFLRLDLSFAATGLVWNSMMSMAGGWFFLTVSEAFVLGQQEFRLPGLGSFMSLAIERGDTQAQILGVLAMLIMIVLVDQLVWRPVVAWSQKFTDEERSDSSHSWLWDRLRRARLFRFASHSLKSGERVIRSIEASQSLRVSGHGARPKLLPLPIRWGEGWGEGFHSFAKPAKYLLLFAAVAGVAFGLLRYVEWLAELSERDWMLLLRSTAATFLRVIAAVALGSLWTIPVGVFIGRRPRWARALQPLIQIAASFPAPMIFPVAVAIMFTFSAGLGGSSILLLMLGTQWYILFNVIAGSTALPHDLLEVSTLARFSLWDRWQKLILPAIFPHLLTGWITAMGGAWNACIVAEYMKYKGRILSTTGLGAAISQATEKGDFPLLAAAVGVMAVTVVGFNRLVWRPLSRSAQTRFALGV